jgi:hypothetical protein
MPKFNEAKRSLLWVINVGFAESLICPVIGPFQTWLFAIEVISPDMIHAPKPQP